MEYQETLEYLYQNLPMYQRVGPPAFKKDLVNIEKLCEVLDNPQQKFLSIHIAGTNGKGSSAHMLASILQTAGYKTGLYTSPHLKSFRERIRINGNMIPHDEVVSFVEENTIHFEEIKPSFFEMTVAMAFDYFARMEVDIAIIEVGLGGRLDSTNIITPIVCLITSISIDHQQFLGESLEEIAHEKAGIMKRNIPVVIGVSQSKLVELFVNHARRINCPIYFANVTYKFEIIDQVVQKLHVKNNSDQTSFYLDLTGHYQIKNLPGVFKTLEILGEMGYPVNIKQLEEGLGQIRSLTGLKGRWQPLSKNPLMICDTGHNKAAIEEIIKQIKSIRYEKLHMIIGMVKDKDIKPMLSLMPSGAMYYFCQPDVPRALPADELSDKAGEYELKGLIIKDVNDAISKAKKSAGNNDLIFVGGSTFVVAEIIDI